MAKRRPTLVTSRSRRASARRGPRQTRSLATRRELIQAGRALFGTQGIYESRIEDITHQAGIAKGTLYLHFASKEALLHAVTRDGLAELQSFVREHTAGKRKLPVLLPAVLRAHLDFFERNPDLMRILHQVRGALKFEQPEWGPLRTLLRAHVELVADELARGEASTWPPARRRALAALVFGTVSGVASVRASLYPDEHDLEQLGDLAAEPLARALLDSSARSARRRTKRAR